MLTKLRTSSQSERQAILLLESQGYTLLKRGWPDFIAIKDGHFICIEVKPNRKVKLKIEQEIVLRLLGKAGIPVYRYSPDKGLKEFDYLSDFGVRHVRAKSRMIEAEERANAMKLTGQH